MLIRGSLYCTESPKTLEAMEGRERDVRSWICNRIGESRFIKKNICKESESFFIRHLRMAVYFDQGYNDLSAAHHSIQSGYYHLHAHHHAHQHQHQPTSMMTQPHQQQSLPSVASAAAAAAAYYQQTASAAAFAAGEAAAQAEAAAAKCHEQSKYEKQEKGTTKDQVGCNASFEDNTNDRERATKSQALDEAKKIETRARVEAEKIKKQARVDAEEIKTQARAAAETQARAAADRIVDQIRSEARSEAEQIVAKARSEAMEEADQILSRARAEANMATSITEPTTNKKKKKKQQHQQRGEAAALELGIRASETEREYEAAIKTLRSDLTDAKMQAETMEKALSIYTDHYTYVARLSRAAGNASMRRCYVIRDGSRMGVAVTVEDLRKNRVFVVASCPIDLGDTLAVDDGGDKLGEVVYCETMNETAELTTALGIIADRNAASQSACNALVEALLTQHAGNAPEATAALSINDQQMRLSFLRLAGMLGVEKEEAEEMLEDDGKPGTETAMRLASQVGVWRLFRIGLIFEHRILQLSDRRRVEGLFYAHSGALRESKTEHALLLSGVRKVLARLAAVGRASVAHGGTVDLEAIVKTVAVLRTHGGVAQAEMKPVELQRYERNKDDLQTRSFRAFSFDPERVSFEKGLLVIGALALCARLPRRRQPSAS